MPGQNGGSKASSPVLCDPYKYVDAVRDGDAGATTSQPAWFNAVVLNVTKDEANGIFYRVRLRGRSGHQPEIDRVHYESIRTPPAPEHSKGDLLEVNVEQHMPETPSLNP